MRRTRKMGRCFPNAGGAGIVAAQGVGNLRSCTTAAISLCMLLFFSTAVQGEHLPFTTYTTLDGLAGDDISSALEDRQGFLWIGTQKGLSRFDGHSFKNFGKAQGLLKSSVTSLALAPDGTIWVGVWGGVYRFDPARGGSFTEIPLIGNRRPIERTRLLVDRAGRLWCGFDGLYRLEETTDGSRLRRVDLDPQWDLTFVTVLLADYDGGIWFGFRHLYHLTREGRAIQLPQEPAEPFELVSLTHDESGQVWAGGVDSLWRVEKDGERALKLQRLAGIPFERTIGVYVVSREGGGVWAGSRVGLYEIDKRGEVIRKITRNHGLVTTSCHPVLRDGAGDLWMGSSESGLVRLTHRGFTSFGTAEGVEATRISSIFRTPSDELIVVGEPHVLQLYQGGRFIPVKPRFPTTFLPGWGWNQAEMQDRYFEWWVPATTGLVRFARARSAIELSGARPLAIHSEMGCFRGSNAFRLFEDSRGDIWASTIERDRELLYRWDRSSGSFTCYDPQSFLGVRAAATAFREDRYGALWIGFYTGQVARYRNGRFECLIDCQGKQQGLVSDIYLDQRGRLWISTGRAGIVRIDDPAAERLDLRRLTVSEGLFSNLTRAVVEDKFGRFYVATEWGVDVFDESTGRISHLGTTQGLPHPYVSVAWADPSGDIWFGTFNGLARFTPTEDGEAGGPPRVLLDSVRVSGRNLPLSMIGESVFEGVLMGPDQRDADITFLALPRSASNGVRFQYRLSEQGDWSEPSLLRSVVLAGLAAGRYRFEVRALDAAGNPSPHTAILSFQILAPFYQRPWFLLLVASVLTGLVLVAYRVRMARVLALGEQRTRIAMDLHDEMGSGLGSIGLLADLASDPASPASRREKLLDQIGVAASELGSSLNDIIWSLRVPDESMEGLGRHLADRGRRMCPGPRPLFSTEFPDVWPRAKLTLTVRRNVLLIGLEALHNAVRHARANTITLELRYQGRRWRLAVNDDGAGMHNSDPVSKGTGFGLETMTRRAAEIGAELTIESGPSRGTSVILTFDPTARGNGVRKYRPLRGKSYDHSKD